MTVLDAASSHSLLVACSNFAPMTYPIEGLTFMATASNHKMVGTRAAADGLYSLSYEITLSRICLNVKGCLNNLIAAVLM